MTLIFQIFLERVFISYRSIKIGSRRRRPIFFDILSSGLIAFFQKMMFLLTALSNPF